MNVVAQTNRARGRTQMPIAPDFSRQAFCIQGLLCDVVTIERAKQQLVTSIRDSRRCNVVTPNANFLRLIRSDPDFRDALLTSDLSVIDGMPLVWLARVLGIAVSDRVCGSDLFANLMVDASQRLSAFFFGATDEVAQRVQERLEESASSVQCAGCFSPGFGPVEAMSHPDILDIINRADPDLLVVSIGARKGLLWLDRNERLLSPPVICNLGATINFVAGSVRRAPDFLRRHGLEWLWRIKEEPTLWKRYALDLRTLISVLICQVVPSCLDRALHRPSMSQLSAAHLRHYQRGADQVLEFYGAWTRDNLAPVRAAFTAATRVESDLFIDLDRITYVDGAFLGQLLLAYGHQRRLHRSFVLRASERRARKLLHLHGCGYLLLAGQEGNAGLPTASTALGGSQAEGANDRVPQHIVSQFCRGLPC